MYQLRFFPNVASPFSVINTSPFQIKDLGNLCIHIKASLSLTLAFLPAGRARSGQPANCNVFRVCMY